MLILRDDIVLSRVQFKDIELIRNWRNSDEVKIFMEHRGHISAEQQVKWFDKINNGENLFFLINVEQKPIGLIYGADIDWKNNIVSNAGIFIADNGNRENRFAFQASILLNDFAFSVGMQKIFIKVLKSNSVAKSYNRLLGYKLLPDQQNNYNQEYVLFETNYQNCRATLSNQIKISNYFKVIFDSQQFDVEFKPNCQTVDYSLRALMTGHILLNEF